MVDNCCTQYIEKRDKVQREEEARNAETQRTFHISFLFCVLYIISCLSCMWKVVELLPLEKLAYINLVSDERIY